MKKTKTQAKVEYWATIGGNQQLCGKAKSLGRILRLAEKCEKEGGFIHRIFEVREISRPSTPKPKR